MAGQRRLSLPGPCEGYKKMNSPKQWKMWAHFYKNLFRHCGSKRYVEIHHIDEPIVPVVLTESPTGRYWGWLENDGKDTPTMIWPSKMQVEMCFPYGPKAESDRGRGRLIQLDIQKDETQMEEQPQAAKTS